MASVRGQAQVKRNMALAVARLEVASTPAAVAMAKQIEGGFVVRSPRDTGRMAGSTQTEATGPGAAQLTVGVDYAIYSGRPALAASVNEDTLTALAATIMRRAL